MKTRHIALGLVVLLCAALLAIPVYSQYQTKVYFDSGGDRLNVASGGELQVESGGLVDIQASATVTVASAVAATGNVSLGDSQSDVITVTGPTQIKGNTTITGTCGVSSTLTALGDVNLGDSQSDSLTLTGPTWIKGNVIITGTVGVSDTVTLSNGETIDNGTNGTVNVTATTLKVTGGGVDVGGDVALQGSASIANASGFATTLNGNADITGTLQYGANNLYAVGSLTSGMAITGNVTSAFTDTVAVDLSALMTTIGACTADLKTDSGANDSEAQCTWSGTTITIKCWKADGATACDQGDTVASYVVFGVR